MNTGDNKFLETKALWVRQRLWEMTMRIRRGHLPSCYSCVDILVALYYGGFIHSTPKEPKHPDRDRLIISKGHAIAALYPILADFGYFPMEELDRYGQRDGILGMFADVKVPGVEAVSDSLGHGLGIGAGMALAAKKDDKKYLVYVILGDAECNEGSVWESAAMAVHYKLGNLIAIIDNNHLGVLGDTVGLNDLGSRFNIFGWQVLYADGHNFHDLTSALLGLRAKKKLQVPQLIMADTDKGKGIPFMEGLAEWHNKMPSPEQEKLGRKALGLEDQT